MEPSKKLAADFICLTSSAFFFFSSHSYRLAVLAFFALRVNNRARRSAPVSPPTTPPTSLSVEATLATEAVAFKVLRLSSKVELVALTLFVSGRYLLTTFLESSGSPSASSPFFDL